MVNQIETHPYCFDAELIAFCQVNKIVVEAYAPFASGAYGLLEDPKIVEIAKRTERSTGQVILRWLVQQGIAVLPKSSSVARIRQNLQLFDFKLSEAEMYTLSTLNQGKPFKRSCPDPNTIL